MYHFAQRFRLLKHHFRRVLSITGRVSPLPMVAVTTAPPRVSIPALKSIQRELLKYLTGHEVQDQAIDEGLALSERHRQVAGVYESFDKVIAVTCKDDTLQAHMVYKIDPLPDEHMRLFPLGDDCYGALNANGERRGNLAFVYNKTQHKHPAFVFDGSRQNPRVG